MKTTLYTSPDEYEFSDFLDDESDHYENSGDPEEDDFTYTYTYDDDFTYTYTYD